MNTNFLTRLTNRTISAGLAIRPQLTGPETIPMPEPAVFDGWRPAPTATVMPLPAAAPHRGQEVHAAFASGAPTRNLPPQAQAALPPASAPVEHSSTPVLEAVVRTGPATAPAHLPATQAQPPSHSPLFSPLVEPVSAVTANHARRATLPAIDPPVAQTPLTGLEHASSVAPHLPVRRDPYVTHDQPGASDDQPLNQPPTATALPKLARLVTLVEQSSPRGAEPVISSLGEFRPQLASAASQNAGDGNAKARADAPAGSVIPSPQAPAVAAPAPPPMPPPIRVTIGRIEVRAVHPPPPVARPKATRPQPALSLDAYLQQRKGGRP